MGENCSTGCPTKDHASFGECLRGKSLKVAYCNSASGHDRSRQKQWDRDLQAYRDARAEGHQPKTTMRRDVEAAKKIGDMTGKAFQAA